VIDGTNRRIGKKVNGALVQGLLYETQLRVAAELDGSNNVVSRFVYATRANIPDFMIRGGATYRIICDHIGSPRLVVDVQSGVVAQRMNYDEWGVVTEDSNPGFQPFGFGGRLYDADSGFLRFGVRDYDPRVGRWTSRDPLRILGGVNLYSYSFNDPINKFDGDGRIWSTIGRFVLRQALKQVVKRSVLGGEGNLNEGENEWLYHRDVQNKLDGLQDTLDRELEEIERLNDESDRLVEELRSDQDNEGGDGADSGGGGDADDGGGSENGGDGGSAGGECDEEQSRCSSRTAPRGCNLPG
jgi:RHS repeat-associated protein